MSHCPVTSLMLMTAASGKNFSFSIHVILWFVRSLINFIQINSNHVRIGRKREIRKNPSRVFFFIYENKNRSRFAADVHFSKNSSLQWSMGNFKMLLCVATNIFHVKIIRCGFGWNFIRIFEHLCVIKIRRSGVFVQMLLLGWAKIKCKTSDFILKTVKFSLLKL